jgi:thioredoxin-dependent peroxiredoxin
MAILSEGDKAPQLFGVDQHDKEVSLQDYSGKKVILYFYPKDNTPGCTAESCNLRDNFDSLQREGYEVIGVSPDTTKSHLKFIDKFNLPFRLIADTENKLAEAFGVWGLKKFMGKEYMGILRTTFILDGKGVIVKVINKVDTKNHAAQII